jgi:hypothetical protein
MYSSFLSFIDLLQSPVTLVFRLLAASSAIYIRCLFVLLAVELSRAYQSNVISLTVFIGSEDSGYLTSVNYCNK